MSGGAALYAAAIDRCIRAVIAQVPSASGEAIALVMAPYLPCIYTSRQESKAGKKPDLLKVFPTDAEMIIRGDPSVLINDLDLLEFTHRFDEKQPLRPSVTPQALLKMVAFEPLACVHRISPTPLPLVVSDTNNCALTFTKLKTYQKSLDPKRLTLLQREGHFDPYLGDVFEQNITA